MSEQLKYIVGEINKPPFGKSYNLISFDGLDSVQLIQILNDVCANIESKVCGLVMFDPYYCAFSHFSF